MAARLLLYAVAFVAALPLVSRGGDECVRSYLDLRRLIGKEDYERAFEHCVGLLERFPDFPPLYEAIAELGLYTRRWDRSEEFFAERIRKGIEVPLSLYGYASSLASRDNPANAIQFCMEAIERGLTYSGVFKELAYAYEKAYGDNEALSMLGRLSRRFPRSAGYHYAVAVELWSLGDYRPVVVRLKEAVALDPAQPRYGDALAVADLHLAYSRGKAERVEVRRSLAMARGDIAGSQFLISSLLSDQIYAGDHRRRDTVLQQSTAEASEFGFLRWLGWNLQKRADVEALASNYSIARRLAGMAKEFALRSREDDLEFVAIKRICGTFFEEGIYDSALHYANLWVSKSAAGHKKREYVSSLGRLAQAYHALGQNRLAFEYAIESVTQADISNVDSATQAEIEIIFGGIQESLGNLASALAHYEHAAGALSTSGSMPYGVAAALGSLGQLYLQSNELNKAARFLKAQQNILRGLDYPAEMANALLNWGDYFFAKRFYERAKAQYYASLEMALRAGNWQLEFDALRKIAAAQTALGNSSIAIKAFERADRVARQGRENGKLDFPVLIQTLKAKAFAEFECGLVEQGLHTLEAVRYAELNNYWESSISRLRDAAASGPSSSTIEKTKRLVRAYDALRSHSEPPLATPSSHGARLSALAEIYDARLALSRTREALVCSKERLLRWNVQLEDPILALKSFLVQTPSVVVQYVISDSKIMAVVAMPDTIFSTILPGSLAQIKAEFQAFSRTFHSGTGSVQVLHPSMITFDFAAGHALYRQLIEPALKGVPPYFRMVVIADGFLRSLSFEALVTKPVKPGDQPSFLIEDFEVSYCYSLGQLGEPEDAKGAVGSILLCGNIAPSRADWLKSSSKPTEGIVGSDVSLLPQLPAARDEISEIRTMMSPLGKVVEGSNATRKNLMREIPLHDVVHIATHAVVNSRDAEFSGMVLTPEKGDPNGGNLSINELRLLKCNAKLVVLSGCNTACVPDSGTAISLALAFEIVGSQAAIGSLWDLQDDNSKELMTVFYRGLARGACASSALRAAKIELLRKNRRGPFFWANYVLYGYPCALPNGLPQDGISNSDLWVMSILFLSPIVNFFGCILALLMVVSSSGCRLKS